MRIKKLRELKVGAIDLSSCGIAMDLGIHHVTSSTFLKPQTGTCHLHPFARVILYNIQIRNQNGDRNGTFSDISLELLEEQPLQSASAAESMGSEKRTVSWQGAASQGKKNKVLSFGRTTVV